MLKYLLFIITTIMFSCNSHSENKGATERYNINEESNIVHGTWKLISIQNLKCNVCPSIEFHGDGTGEFTKPSNEVFYYNWKLEGNRISLSFSTELEKASFFTDETEFDIHFYKEGAVNFVALTSLNKKRKYILGKVLN